jgi:hypothetical protein
MLASALVFGLAVAQDTDTDALAKAAQNPISSLIGVPFQWNSTSTSAHWTSRSMC